MIKIYKKYASIILFTLLLVTWLRQADKRVTGLLQPLTCPLALVGTWTGVDLQLTILHLHTHARTCTCMSTHIRNYTRPLDKSTKSSFSISIPPREFHLEHFTSSLSSTNKYFIALILLHVNKWKNNKILSNHTV